MAVEKEALKSGAESNETDKSSNSGKDGNRPVRRTSRGTVAAARAITKTVVTRAKKISAEARKNIPKQPKEKSGKEKGEENKDEDTGAQDSKNSLKEELPKKMQSAKSKDDDKKAGCGSGKEDKSSDAESTVSSLAPDSNSSEKGSEKMDSKGGDGSVSSCDVVCVDSISETMDSSFEAPEDKDFSGLEGDGKEESLDVDLEKSSDEKKDEDSNNDGVEVVTEDVEVIDEKSAEPLDEEQACAAPKEEAEAEKTIPAKTKSPVPKETSVHRSPRTLRITRRSSVTLEKSSPKGSGNDSTINGNKAATKSAQEKKSSEINQGEKDLGEKVKRIAPNDKTLWVSSLSNKTRAADLKSLFSKYGKVSTAKILTNSKTPGARCYGLVTMFSSKDALACIEHLHHTELHGRVISVEKTRLSIKKQQAAVTNKALTEEDKTKKEGIPEKADAQPTEKKSEDKKETKDSKNSDKPDKAELKSPETKAKNKDDQKTGALKSVSKSKHSSPRKSGEKRSRDRDVKRSSKERNTRSRNRSRSSRERNLASRTHSRSYGTRNRGLDRVRSRRFSPVEYPAPRSRIRSRSPLVRPGISHFNRSRSPIGRERFPRDRYGSHSSRNLSRDRYNIDYKDPFDDDRERERKNRQETLRLERERERLRIEREELEREKARILRLEKEHQRLEREKLESEMEELRKYSMILKMTESRSPKQSLEKEPLWEDRKRPRLHDRAPVSHPISGRDSRHEADPSNIDRYYDTASSRRLERPAYHSSSVGNTIDHLPTWNSTMNPDQSKYGGSSVTSGIWARMDVPPPTPVTQRWGPMDQPRLQHPGPIGPQSHSAPIGSAPDQVVMFVGNNPNANNSVPGQYPNSNRFNSNNGRRF